jgi:hypothetical protein
MKEQILKILKKNYYPLGELDDDEQCAEEITSHVFEFLEWLKYHCYRHLHLWGIVDDTSSIYYGNEEIYDWWFKHISSHGGVRMLPVTSSQIKSVGYASNTLYVEFLKGGVYSYKDVPDNMFEDFMEVGSKGHFFANAIKGKFDFVKTEKIVTNGELK